MKKLLYSSLLLSSFLFSNEAGATSLDSTEQIQNTNFQEITLEKPIVEETTVEPLEFIFDGTQTEITHGDITVRKLSYNPLIFKNRITTLGAGVWDYLGEEYFTNDSSVYPSYGGDYMVTLIHPRNAKYIYELREQDPIIYQTVDRFTIDDEGELPYYEIVFRNISGWVDGDDGQAEFYLSKLAPSFTKVSAAFWD